MEWDWCWKGKNGMLDVTPLMLFESSGDSEEVKSDVHHHGGEAAMDESQDVLFRFCDEDEDDDDDDAQSCSYDHSSYVNRSYGNGNQKQTQGLIYDDYDDDGHDDDDGEVSNDEDDHNHMNKIWGETKMIDPSMQQKRSGKFCVDSSNQRELDRKFWEACLAS